ncbi:MAG TPA: class II histone deacetylase [Thiopseudomonas sp.]|nr:class II histone deacetylase [Thiopseudomonas sp.]
MKTGFVWDERYMWYEFGSCAQVLRANEFIQPGTLIESPESKRRVLNLLSSLGLLENLHAIKPQPITLAELKHVHDPEYVDRVKLLSEGAGGSAGPGAPMPVGGFDIAVLAAGGAKAAIESVLKNEVQNAYALIRPPGHHAEYNYGMSLCVFNNIAIAVESVIKKGLVKKVAIIDWDAHHGNGTESLFYQRSDVLTLSIHQDQMVPGRGMVEDNGEGEGIGHNINIPLPPGCGSGAYYAAFEKVILPAITSFQPDLIVVACGLDAAINDPSARMLLTPNSYRKLTRMLMQAANDVCAGRLVMVHEGGYEPTTAPFCALAIIEELSGISTRVPVGKDPIEMSYGQLVGPYQDLQEHQEAFVKRAQDMMSQYW